MFGLNKEVTKEIMDQFPVGTKVKLIYMDDIQAPPYGTEGHIVGIDDAGTLKVKWSNGCGLGVVYGVDIIEIIETA